MAECSRVDADALAFVADFGIALVVSAAAGGRLTETGLSLGTPHCMSPEQATADTHITKRADVYVLGAVLYGLLTGAPPHTGAAAHVVILKHVSEVARPAREVRRSVPPHVAAAVAVALEKLHGHQEMTIPLGFRSRDWSRVATVTVSLIVAIGVVVGIAVFVMAYQATVAKG